MLEADPLTIATMAQETTKTVLQAGPPADLPAPVPDFVGQLLEKIQSAAGEGGLGEMISEITPGGGEAAAGGPPAGAGADHAANAASERAAN